MHKEYQHGEPALDRFFAKRHLLLAILFSLTVAIHQANATPTLSNLGDPWTEGGIGDIHALFPGGTPYGTDAANFGTGAGSFSVNAITLEFEFDSSYPAGASAPQALNIQLFQQTGGSSTLVGSFGNPTADSQSTQWPKSSNPNAYTAYYDFSALGSIRLNPFSQYSLLISDPATSSVDAALLFTRSSAYTTTAGWTMGLTTAGDPYAAGEYIVMAVDATPVPDGANTAVLLAGGFVLLIGCRLFLGKARQFPTAEFD